MSYVSDPIEGVMAEGYTSVGKTDKKNMKKMWRASGSKLSLKKWADQQQVGEIAHVWLNFKRRPNSLV